MRSKRVGKKIRAAKIQGMKIFFKAILISLNNPFKKNKLVGPNLKVLICLFLYDLLNY